MRKSAQFVGVSVDTFGELPHILLVTVVTLPYF